MSFNPSTSILRTHTVLTVAVSRTFLLTKTYEIELVPPPTAAPLSVVELVVTVTLDGKPVASESVQFQATPAVTFVPSTVITDDNGRGVVHFRMPEAGEVYGEATTHGKVAARQIP